MTPSARKLVEACNGFLCCHAHYTLSHGQLGHSVCVCSFCVAAREAISAVEAELATRSFDLGLPYLQSTGGQIQLCVPNKDQWQYNVTVTPGHAEKFASAVNDSIRAAVDDRDADLARCKAELATAREAVWELCEAARLACKVWQHQMRGSMLKAALEKHAPATE